MEAYELTIDAKVKINLFDIVSADDFHIQTGRSIDPRIVLEQPTVSLYCLDHANQQALFVDTAPEVNLLQAPFYFIAQYEAAQRLIAIPYATLHALASEVELDPRRIILFYSTGRCGSTLFSHVLNQTPTVVSFSEPDIFTQLVKMRTAGQSNDAEIRALLYDSLMIMSAHAQQHGYQYCAFKFRSYVLSVSDLLYQAVPTARLLFLYRNALTWARSFSRAFGAPDSALEDRVEKYGYRYVIPSIDTHLRTHSKAITWIEYLAHMWVSTMQDSRSLQRQGAALACARFEDVQVAPQAVIQALLTHCGLPMPDPEQLARVLAEDSQAGTAGAQDREEPVRRLSEAELAELDRIIRHYDPTLAPDTILSQTIRL
jgi:sulfotransferase family protein